MTYHPTRRNQGRCPPEAAGKRLIVRLRNGMVCGENPVSSVSPAGWAADGGPGRGARWTLTDSPFDIIAYRIL